ncbi:hypothetical protein ACP70R_032783 [Stipagrostis hirtigluma subsp. patula]
MLAPLAFKLFTRTLAFLEKCGSHPIPLPPFFLPHFSLSSWPTYRRHRPFPARRAASSRPAPTAVPRAPAVAPPSCSAPAVAPLSPPDPAEAPLSPSRSGRRAGPRRAGGQLPSRTGAVGAGAASGAASAAAMCSAGGGSVGECSCSAGRGRSGGGRRRELRRRRLEVRRRVVAVAWAGGEAEPASRGEGATSTAGGAVAAGDAAAVASSVAAATSTAGAAAVPVGGAAAAGIRGSRMTLLGFFSLALHNSGC